MVSFASVKGITIPEGEVKSIARNGTILWQKHKSRLPAEYQEVEYITSTGSQYIDTGLTAKNTYKIEIEFICDSFGRTGGFEGGIYGGENGYNLQAFHLYRTAGQFDIGFSGQVSVGTFSTNTKYNVIVSNGSITINGTNYTGPSGTINTPYNIYLFTLHRSQTFVEGTCSKSIYYCKLYNNDVLIKDYVPCYRKSDGVIGLYDLVNNEFKTNTGSGTFGKGNNV